jgi:alkylation response protein AidB-like acyl-CoA dehydrogenase
MIFQLTRDQETLQESLREVIGDLCVPSRIFEIWRSQTRWDDKLWARLAADGWFGIAVPEADGGAGLDIPELALLAEACGHAGAIGPVAETALAGKLVAAMPPSQARSNYLSSIMNEGARVAIALAPGRLGARRAVPDDVAAKSQGSGIVLNGTYAFTPWAKFADILLLEVRIGGKAVLCIVDPNRADIAIRETEMVDPGTSWSDVTLENVVVEQGCLLPTSPADALAMTMVLSSAGLLGASKHCLSLTVDYAKVRKQFGREIGSFQAVQHLCADMHCGIENLEPSIRFSAACTAAASNKAPYFAAASRLYADDVATMVWTNALQIHAGIGFSWEHELHIYLKRILALQAQYATVDSCRERIVESGQAFSAVLW